jgi:hypothetical protein
LDFGVTYRTITLELKYHNHRSVLLDFGVTYRTITLELKKSITLELKYHNHRSVLLNLQTITLNKSKFKHQSVIYLFKFVSFIQCFTNVRIIKKR